ncbi:MAG: endopolygalacturonase [Candidatus Marinimicrobia bacterium]|nr:endopolygalacturonase [Candidatus Neomarinimicrobiota bacterium]
MLTETLRVHSDTAVIAEPGAVFRLADGAGRHCRSFMIANANPGNGNANISLRGGFWDANNAGNPRGTDYDPFAYTGVAVNFVNVKNLTVCDLTVHNPESFFIRVGEVCDFRIENITLSADRTHINQDGVHVGGFSERGVIRGIRATAPGVPGDDLVALNADDDVERQLNLGMRRGPIRNILVEDLEAADAYTFLRLLSVGQPIEDITVRRLRGGCRVHGLNLNNWRFPKGVGAIRRVLIEDVELTKTQFRPQAPALIHISLHVEDLAIHRFRRGVGTLPGVQTLLIDNRQALDMMLDGRTGQVEAAAGYVQAGGDIETLNLKQGLVEHHVPCRAPCSNRKAHNK